MHKKSFLCARASKPLSGLFFFLFFYFFALSVRVAHIPTPNQMVRDLGQPPTNEPQAGAGQGERGRRPVALQEARGKRKEKGSLLPTAITHNHGLKGKPVRRKSTSFF